MKLLATAFFATTLPFVGALLSYLYPPKFTPSTKPYIG